MISLNKRTYNLEKGIGALRWSPNPPMIKNSAKRKYMNKNKDQSKEKSTNKSLIETLSFIRKFANPLADL